MNLKKLCEGFSRAVGVLSKVFLLCSIIAVAMIAVVSSVDSIGRYILGSALRGASEYVETGMAVFVYGGLAMAIRERKCVTVPVFLEMMKPRLRLIFVGIGNACCAVAGILVCSQVWASASRNMSNLAYTTEVVKIPYGPFYLFAFLGLCLTVLELLIVAIRDLHEAVVYKKIHAIEEVQVSVAASSEGGDAS